MNDKKILIGSLVLIIIALLIYIFNLQNANDQANTNTGSMQEGINQNITEPPVPTPMPGPAPSPKPTTQNGSFTGKSWWLDEIVLDGAAVSLDVNVPAALTLNFDKEGYGFNGFAGCNNYSGKFTSEANGSFDFGAVASTKKYCVGASDLENKVLQAMEKIEKFGFDGSGNLILETSDKKTRLEYVPAV